MFGPFTEIVRTVGHGFQQKSTIRVQHGCRRYVAFVLVFIAVYLCIRVAINVSRIIFSELYRFFAIVRIMQSKDIAGSFYVRLHFPLCLAYIWLYYFQLWTG